MLGSGFTGTGTGGADSLLSSGGPNTLVGLGGFNRDQVNEWNFLVFSGFGTEAQGATFRQIGTTDQWQIHSGLDAHDETITFSNHATLLAGDFVFV